MSMELLSISVAKAPDYGLNKGNYLAQCRVKGLGDGYSPDITLVIPPEKLLPVAEFLESLVVETFTEAAASFATSAIENSQLRAGLIEGSAQ